MRWDILPLAAWHVCATTTTSTQSMKYNWVKKALYLWRERKFKTKKETREISESPAALSAAEPVLAWKQSEQVWRQSESETAWWGSGAEGREQGRPLWAQGEDLTLSLTHTCESSCCCCGEGDEGVGWYGSYRWRQSSERTTAPQKGLTERRESGTACSCCPVWSHSPSFIHVWRRWRRRSFFFFWTLSFLL